jgi:glycine/D-amino acid oxidase-like deaminating enzyme
VRPAHDARELREQGPGAGRPPAGDARATLASLQRELADTFPADSGLSRLPVTHVWTGVIGYTLDALPAIGRDPERPAVVHALGWCGHGLALSVASGAWLSRLLFQEPSLLTLAPGALTSLAQLAWSRAAPPALPGEALRWLAFRADVGAMALLDRIA